VRILRGSCVLCDARYAGIFPPSSAAWTISIRLTDEADNRTTPNYALTAAFLAGALRPLGVVPGLPL